jgi:hypothetical protein
MFTSVKLPVWVCEMETALHYLLAALVVNEYVPLGLVAVVSYFGS